MKYKFNKLLFMIQIVFLNGCFQPENEPGLFTISFISTNDSINLSDLFINAYLYDSNEKIIKVEIDSSDFNMTLSKRYETWELNNNFIPITNSLEFYYNPLKFNVILFNNNSDTIFNSSVSLELYKGEFNLILVYLSKKYNKSEPKLANFFTTHSVPSAKFNRKSFGIVYSDTQSVATDSVYFLYYEKNE